MTVYLIFKNLPEPLARIDASNAESAIRAHVDTLAGHAVTEQHAGGAIIADERVGDWAAVPALNLTEMVAREHNLVLLEAKPPVQLELPDDSGATKNAPRKRK